MGLVFNPFTGTFDFTGSSGGGGTIGGTIAATQVAFGTGVDTIGGSNDLTFVDATNTLTIGVTGGTLAFAGAGAPITFTGGDDGVGDTLLTIDNADGYVPIQFPSNTDIFGAASANRLSIYDFSDIALFSPINSSFVFDNSATPPTNTINNFLNRVTATNLAVSDIVFNGRFLSEVGYGGTAFVGHAHGLSQEMTLTGAGNAGNEYAGIVNALNVQIGAGYTQTTGPVGGIGLADWGVQGPIGVQTTGLVGEELVINNYYNGNPSGSSSGGKWIVTYPTAGPGVDPTHIAATTYPVQVGLGIVGRTTASGIGFTTAIQIGGTGSPWAEDSSRVGTGVDIRDIATRGIYLHDFTSATAPAIEIVGANPIVLGNGSAIRSDTTTAHTALLQAYDVDGGAYSTFATLTNGNTPTFVVTPPSGGTVTVNATTLQQGGNAITLGNSFTTSGNFSLTLTQTGATNVTLPTSGTLLTTTGSGTALTFPGTLSIASGKVLTASNTLTFTGTDSTSFAFPSTSDTVVALTATQTLTNKRITKRVVTASDATSITPNSDNADITYQANTQGAGTLTINADGGTPTNGQSWVLKIKSTNVQTFAWNSIYVGGTVALPTVTTGGTKIDYFVFIYDSVTPKWDYTGTAMGF